MLTIKQMNVVNEDNDNFDTFLRTQHGIGVSQHVSVSGDGHKVNPSERFVYDYKTKTQWYPDSGRIITIGKQSEPQ